ncbi:hypothetical protein TWF106_009533 [Orbilia oligospora]|uniref:Uncharacterized protein n=1 Tax=Orbilia oligospora TaxID=2813651 RepID=A0A6G1MK81_ORBOL|nr:hypothetical protein TWF788_003804 [Orbilia oligospora]KAF3213153.1 hypothetical protein TWF679_005379 [Orbilia oligospora]KAF3213406.1 hypothetical protein TWF106_009533 [Orbilia oligospora]KAF3229957.1 hypothetical protein TWF191_000860 [Orbilia oligospora]KAF3260595.1 hypothetical protein TWF192_009876 [Orbilia oligospora]
MALAHQVSAYFNVSAGEQIIQTVDSAFPSSRCSKSGIVSWSGMKFIVAEKYIS